MKTERLLSILVLLLNKKQITAKELAEYFEVSQRTIYRDIDTLNQAGIPIFALKGASGGICIVDSYKIDKNFLNSGEIKTLFTALNGIKNIFTGKEVEMALEKIKSVFPENEIAKASENQSIIIDYNAWWITKKDTEKLNLLTKAIDEKSVIRFYYRNNKGEADTRNVEPAVMIFKGYMWYLYGFCREKKDYRMFKLTRIKELEICHEKYESSHKWVEPSNGIDISAREEPEEVVLRFSPAVSQQAEDYFESDEIKWYDDGRMEGKIRWPVDEWMLRFILGYGENVEVISPLSLRETIKEKIANMVKNYKI